MYQHSNSFRSLNKPYVLINTDFSIRDVTDSLVEKINRKRDQILRMNISDFPSGNITPIFSSEGAIEYLLYEFNSDSIDKMREDFILTASHELKTPLTALKLQVQLANKLINGELTKPLTPKQIKTFIERANQGVSRLSQLVDDMLLATVTKELENQNKMIWFNLEEFMERFLRNATERFNDFKKRVQVKIAAPEMVFWNIIQIEQVFFNLLSNAYRFGEDSLIKLTVTSGGGYAYFSVEDQGPGISKEDQIRLFNIFAKGNTRQCGLGLGLYNCKEIVRAHSGKISVASNPDKKGACIEVCIPLSPRSVV